MDYTINEYQELENKPVTRIELYPNNDEASQLLSIHLRDGCRQLQIWELFGEGALRVPLPAKIISSIKEKVCITTEPTIVLGIDSYLDMLDEQNIQQFFLALRGFLDEQKYQLVFLVSRNLFRKKVFSNPKYENSLQIIRLLGEKAEFLPFKVCVYPIEYVSSKVGFSNFQELLKNLGNFLETGEHTIILHGNITKQAGLSSNVQYFTDAKYILSKYYGVDLPLDSNVTSALLIKCKEYNLTPEQTVEQLFGIINITPLYALKRLLELKTNELWPAFIWLLKRRLDKGTYLSLVLQNQVFPETLLYTYTVDTVVDFVLTSDSAIHQYASERAAVLKMLGISFEPMIVDFINRVKPYGNALPFLNCGTFAEQCEVIRRAGQLDLTTGLPDEYGTLSTVLEDYLASFSYGNRGLDKYFKNYRRYSVKNEVPADFVQMAMDCSHTFHDIKMRDSALLNLSTSPDTALLVVDGMGAEYLPFLISAGKRYGLAIVHAEAVSVRLPSSTHFNPIKWQSDRILEEVRSVDNIAHYGVSRHERCTNEANLYTTLEKINNEVFKRVYQGLSEFSKVVVTADHGVSKLAVTAHKAGQGATLPWHGEPLDWRYSEAISDMSTPEGMEEQYCPSNGITYWVVRGYNRLPKKGPKQYALHGGATLEERLVPFVVFSLSAKGGGALEKPEKKTKQLVEKDDFDI